MPLRPTFVALALSLVAAFSAESQQSKAEVLVLGVYHMANPGHDIFNTQADDVLAPKRQQEIAQLIDVLKKFKPTKIAIEENVWSKRAAHEYADYLSGKYTLTRNEIDQIGYRLAKEAGHANIYAVDVDGDFPYQRLINYAKGSGRAKDLDAIQNEISEMVKAQNGYLAAHSVLETMLYINSDARVAQADGFYYRQAHFGEAGDWAGADLLADWYQRNIRIYSNVIRLVDSPNERILVIYGSGHLGWLRHDFESNPTIRLRKLAEFGLTETDRSPND
jgi:hypothetical protein